MRYLDQLLRDIALVRLRRCGELAARQQLHLREHMLGYSCTFHGAAGEEGAAIFEQQRLKTEATDQSRPNHEDGSEVERNVESFLRGPDGAMPGLAARIGIDLEALPPADVLSDEQLSAIIAEMKPTLALHGATLAAPKDYPPRLEYPLLLKLARSKRPIISTGGFVDDGCSGDPVGCTWGMYCPCLKYSRKAEFVSDGGDPSFPDERFYQGEGDPFALPERTPEELAEQAAFDALPLEEKMKVWDAEAAAAPPCPMHGEACGAW